MKLGESALSGRTANALAQAERTFDGRAAEKVCHQHLGNDLAEAGAVGWLAVDIEKGLRKQACDCCMLTS